MRKLNFSLHFVTNSRASFLSKSTFQTVWKVLIKNYINSVTGLQQGFNVRNELFFCVIMKCFLTTAWAQKMNSCCAIYYDTVKKIEVVGSLPHLVVSIAADLICTRTSVFCHFQIWRVNMGLSQISI